MQLSLCVLSLLVAFMFSANSLAAKDNRSTAPDQKVQLIQSQIIKKENEIKRLRHQFLNAATPSMEPEEIMTQVHVKEKEIHDLVIQKELLESVLANEVREYRPASGK